ncbi:alkaline phosphatase D family protein [Bdellovibrio reynosensis]|uniref:Alkaline phosphatase family protein n=1 Tax=Bdellovibrio reynosensis TaxID=2835041 RepID=A0ABY4CA08_9BACT|nr:alkaline phosphatase D family protein [Bdellovibrio reynosensis]UOF01624.1 alkaline phosphatase family protein [Bdellovibrio reynosensis]
MLKNVLILIALIVAGCAQTQKTAQQGEATKDAVYVSMIPSRGIDYETAITTIAFGSCANQDQPEPLWKDISAANPDLFLFLGDNIYASTPTQKPIAEQYRKLDQIPEYRAIREQVPFLATWDDHDYGLRDGGKDWQGKEAARRDFINYWSYVRNSIPFEQNGIYHAKVIGPKKKAVQVIMLDTRYFRSALLEKPGNEGKAYDYLPNEEGTILGDAQWNWLEEQLKKPASVRIIVSSIQMIANEPKYEKWGNFPKERQRFFDLLKKTKAKNVVILSGDRHIASIAKTQVKNYGDLYEITASSINRANSFSDSDKEYIGAVYNKENFGLASIDWKKKKMQVEIRGFNNEVANRIDIPLR